MKTKENNKPINLSKLVPNLAPPEPPKGWKPTLNGDHITHTMPFGGAIPPMINVNPLKEDK